MSGAKLASKAGSKVSATACAALAAMQVLAVAAMCIVGAKPVQALPSYARQTGQQCAACHNGFPELTPYGRLFKLNGYTFTGGPEKSFPEAIVNVPPISMMNIPTYTHTAQGQPGGAAPGKLFSGPPVKV